MSSPTPCFTSGGHDPLFLNSCTRLHDSTLTIENLEALWKSSYKHFMCMLGIYPDFCKGLKPDYVIDVSQPATSLYNQAFTQNELPLSHIEDGYVATMICILLCHDMTKEEVRAFNLFINVMIKTHREPPTLQKAA